MQAILILFIIHKIKYIIYTTNTFILCIYIYLNIYTNGRLTTFQTPGFIYI